MRRMRAISWGVVAALAVVIAGCASTAGTATPVAAIGQGESLTRYTKVVFLSSSADTAASMTSSDRDRIVALVTRKLKEKAPTRFADLAPRAVDPDTLQVKIAFTRYEEGSAFARFMLAGLGQIHIDADVTLEDQARPAPVGRYAVTKTFAWGGIYGGTTDIRDVEDGFAEAVAKILLGQPSD